MVHRVEEVEEEVGEVEEEAVVAMVETEVVSQVVIGVEEVIWVLECMVVMECMVQEGMDKIIQLPLVIMVTIMVAMVVVMNREVMDSKMHMVVVAVAVFAVEELVVEDIDHIKVVCIRCNAEAILMQFLCNFCFV